MTVSVVPPDKNRLTKEYLEHLKEAVNSPLNPVTYLAIDPGKSNGICAYDAKFYLVFMLTIQADDMTMFLDQFDKIEKCVMENYLVYPQKATDHVYSSLETPRVIGRIESWAERKKITLITQPASIKPTAYKWIGKKPLPKSNPRNHEMDAHAHFMYWAVSRGMIPAESLLKRSTK